MQVATFDTVEDFWALMNYVSEANNLPVGSDYSLFKVAQQNQKLVYFGWATVEHIFQMIILQEGICPDWEDLRNTLGGRWMVSFHFTFICLFVDWFTGWLVFITSLLVCWFLI